ncbi:hypothetical protein niasHT_008485 [Heterodera trifolii]|uniref:Arrestin C-terminal-like domain-containing protein n=1 Tax=Heterodera trifolii TaxID=157864 RepID=A0ABD2M2E9_9BILA
MVHKQNQLETTAAPIAAAQNDNGTADIFEQFEIMFNGDKSVFFGNETVTGSLKIKLKQETVLNAIHLHFKGVAKWVGTGRKEDNEGQTEKIYFDKNFVLLERPPGHPGPGHFKFVAHFAYSLPFECPLPSGCETSYESGSAHIRYFARAILETEQRDKFIAKKAFTIVSSPGLDQLVLPHPEPITCKETVRYGGCCCCGCCCRHRIHAELQLPKSAYSPGENIVGSLHIDSWMARYAVDNIEVRLLDGAERIQPVSGGDQQDAKKEEDKVAPESGTDQQNEPEAEKRKKRNANKKKPPKTRREKHAKVPEASSVCQRVVAGRKLDGNALLAAVPEEKHEKRRRRLARLGMDNVVFIKVPAVIPTIEKEVADDQQSVQHDEHAQQGQRVLMESPSTATIRARREPFIGVKYALQVALGTHILFEVPIKVVYPTIRNADDANGIKFVPFACGAQPISEPDEANLRGGPFMFTPQYPMYTESPPRQPQQLETIKESVAELMPADHQLPPNGTAIVSDDGGGIVVPTVSELTETTVTTTTVHHTQQRHTVETMEQQQQLLPNGAKTYQNQQQHQQEGNEQIHDERQQQQQQPTVFTDEMPQHNAITQNGHAEPALNGELNGDMHHPNEQQENHILEETYEVVENEDGTKTTIHKSTERHFLVNDEAAAEEEEDKKDQQQQLLHNQQMDVSMSG